MAESVHFVAEGTVSQTPAEQLIRTLTTTNQASGPVVSTVKVYDKDDEDTEVTSTVISGSSSVAGDVITLPKLSSLSEGTLYRVEVKFTEANSNVYEAYFYVQAER